AQLGSHLLREPFLAIQFQSARSGRRIVWPPAPRLCLIPVACGPGPLLVWEPDNREAIEQAMLAVRVDLEMNYAAIRAANFLLLEVDCQRCVGAAISIIKQLFQIFRRHTDRQQAVLEAVVVENIAERS